MEGLEASYGESMKSNYDHLSKEDLVAQLIKRDSERKLGLVWERDQIEHERALNNDFVALDLVPELSVGVAPYPDLLIEGDNFDALRYLHIAYKGRVKCIYIDPPYNTGKNDFIYNDKFVDEEDSFRHSKWLEYLFRRLDLAKDLLTDDGVIFVSIGETEYANLSLLMEQILPGMRVGTFVWRRRSGANDAKEWFLSVDHEYVLCYANKGFSFAGQAKNLGAYSNPDNDERGDWNNDNLVQGKNYKQRPDAYYSMVNPETGVWYPCDLDNTWRFATEARLQNGKKIRTKPMEQIIAEKRVLWPNDEETVVYNTVAELKRAIDEGNAPKNLRVYLTLDELREQVEAKQAPERLLGYIEPLENWVGREIGYGKPRYKRFLCDLKRTERPVSTWVLPSSIKKEDLEMLDLGEVEAFQVGFTSEGTTLLNQMIGNKDFSYPKPLSLLKSLIAQATDAESGHIVLDFFAGSGTTAHAVMACNDEDGGNRSYILVSSTESTEKEPDKNVCRDITTNRLRAAIDGYSYRAPKGTVAVEGLGGEFAYLRTRRIPFESLYLDIQHDQIWYALQLLHTSGIAPYVAHAPYQERETDAGNVVYIPELQSPTLEAILEIANAALSPLVVYTWQPGLLTQSIYNEQVCIEPIPEYLIQRFGRNAR